MPWGQFLRRYDRPGMLFYLEPPYRASGARTHRAAELIVTPRSTAR